MKFPTLLSLCFCAIFVAAGCRSTGARADVEKAASHALGFDDAVVFQTEAGALDVLDELPDTLNLADAVRLTLKHHAGIHAAFARVRAAEADADQARLLPNPILTVVFRFPEGSGKPIIEAGLAADLIQILRRPGSISAADNRLRAASAEAIAAVLDAISELRQTYYAVQSLQASAPLLEARRDLLVRLQELSRSRLEAGEGSRLETTTLDAQRVEVEAELDDLLLDLTEQRLTLARILGQPSSDAEIRVSPWQPPAVKSVRERRWIPAALEGRPELQAV